MLETSSICAQGTSQVTFTIAFCPEVPKASTLFLFKTARMSHQLTPAAEDLRKQIKELIPETAKGNQTLTNKVTVPFEDQGSKCYGGKLLKEKVDQLLKEIDIGEVCEPARLGCCVTYN
jgi:hypothetical protein